MSRISAATPEAIESAAELIGRGRVVSYPTETSYGLGADATSDRALASLLQIKGRGEGHTLPLLVADRSMLHAMVEDVPPAAERLIERFWPGPLTIVLRARRGLAPALVNAKGEVGVRISSDPIAQRLVSAVGRPLTATSANRSAEPAARVAAEAALEGVALVLDDGPRTAEPSTVVAIRDELVVLRQGAIRVDD